MNLKKQMKKNERNNCLKGSQKRNKLVKLLQNTFVTEIQPAKDVGVRIVEFMFAFIIGDYFDHIECYFFNLFIVCLNLFFKFIFPLEEIEITLL